MPKISQIVSKELFGPHATLPPAARPVFRPYPPDDEAAEIAAARQRFLDARRDMWERICPDEFLATDPARLAPPAQDALAVRIPRDSIGLMFSGGTGHGKSRTAWLKAGRMFCSKSIRFVHRRGIDLGDEILAAYETGTVADLRNDLQDADLLLIDDLFKGNWKPSVEAMIFNVIDHRISWRKATIITTNSDGKAIKALLSRDMKEPFMRRISREFFRPFKFDLKPKPA